MLNPLNRHRNVFTNIAANGYATFAVTLISKLNNISSDKQRRRYVSLAIFCHVFHQKNLSIRKSIMMITKTAY